MFYFQIQKDEFVFQQSEPGFCFFIVQAGSVQLIVNNKLKKLLKPADGFGEQALLYDTKRISSARTKQKCKLWVIDRQAFRQAVEEVIINEYSQNRKCLEGIRYFQNLTNDQKDTIALALTPQKFYKNQIIIQEGDPGSSLYYIKQGIASAFKDSKFIKRLGKGDSFGEQSLYYNTMRQLTVKVDEQVTCLILGRDTLHQLFRNKLQDVTFKNFIKWTFEKNDLLNKLNKTQTQNVIQAMKVSSFKANQVIFQKDIPAFQKMIVVIEGSLKQLKSGNVVARKGQCWGLEHIFQPKTQIQYDEIRMQGDGVLAQITKSKFSKSIGNLSYDQIIKDNQKSRQKIDVNILNQAKDNKINLQISDLIHVKNIEKGQFGPVQLFQDMKKNLFTVKFLQKSLLKKYQVEKFISDQQKILSSITFPFVIQMKKSFQTKNYLFYLQQYVQGVDFQKVKRALGLLTAEDSKFYVASIILILDYFNNNQIVCRDIRPENFMIDKNGYMKLINMPGAKFLRSGNDQICRTYTIIGTPHYMAPDIISGKGYDNLVDLWSLGVCLYQFLYGVLPFGNSKDDVYQIYEQILKSELKFPKVMINQKAQQMMKQLLSFNPQQRHSGSFFKLKSHPWFENMNWDKLLNKDNSYLKPPYVPEFLSDNIKSQQKSEKLPSNNIKPQKQPEMKFLKYLVSLEDKESINNQSRDSFDWSSFGQQLL